MTEPSVQRVCLLRIEMVLYAIDIKQPLPLGRFTLGALQAVEGLHIDNDRSVNWIARLENQERRVSFEEE